MPGKLPCPARGLVLARFVFKANQRDFLTEDIQGNADLVAFLIEPDGTGAVPVFLITVFFISREKKRVGWVFLFGLVFLCHRRSPFIVGR